MSHMTAAQRHDWLVKQGADRFVETFSNLFKVMSEGGYTPGVTVPSKAELRALYESTNEGYWRTLAATDPAEAKSQIKQWKSVGNT